MIQTCLIEQIIKKGTSFQMISVVILGIFVYYAYSLARRGKAWGIRPLEALVALEEGIGRSAEMGRPVLVLTGNRELGGSDSAQEMAGLTVLGEVAQRGAELGVPVYTSTRFTDMVAASEQLMKSAYTAAGKPELYEPGKYVHWFGEDQYSYCIGACGQMMTYRPGMVIYMGFLQSDILISGETGHRIGAQMIGGTCQSIGLMAMMCDYMLIGEEMYAASASITKDPIPTSTIAAEDWMKIIMTLLMVVGVILQLAGSTAILDLMGM